MAYNRNQSTVAIVEHSTTSESSKYTRQELSRSCDKPSNDGISNSNHKLGELKDQTGKQKSHNRAQTADFDQGHMGQELYQSNNGSIIQKTVMCGEFSNEKQKKNSPIFFFQNPHLSNVQRGRDSRDSKEICAVAEFSSTTKAVGKTIYESTPGLTTNVHSLYTILDMTYFI